MEICRLLNSDHYINSIGGKDLYSKEEFKNNGIELQFLKPKLNSYIQFTHDFTPYLSIIDIIMFNDLKDIRKYLMDYELV